MPLHLRAVNEAGLRNAHPATRSCDYAAKLNETPEMAAQKGMEEMSEKFREMGGSIYLKS
jgi:hypothetical protein